jgi:ABC-2 type transport system ATP-binding protein
MTAAAITRAANEVEPVLTADGLRKCFRSGPPWHHECQQVLRDASLEVRPGELVGLVGENGSGKSTLMQIIVGLLPRDGGELLVPGRLGYCPQEPLLWDKLTVREHFELFANAYSLDQATARARRDALLEELGFTRYLDYRVERLSGGTSQKLNLALALLHEPELLLLDEPYAGFDWETYLKFWDMAEHRRARGMAILIVSHLLAERERLTRVYELRDGRCVVAGPAPSSSRASSCERRSRWP